MAPVTSSRSRGLSVDEYLKSFGERRSSSRTSVSREIVIQIDQQPMHTAILENISLGGAKFRMMYPTQLPKQFDIIGAGDNERPVPCEVVWQKHDRVGVKFLTP